MQGTYEWREYVGFHFGGHVDIQYQNHIRVLCISATFSFLISSIQTRIQNDQATQHDRRSKNYVNINRIVAMADSINTAEVKWSCVVGDRGDW